MALVQWQPSRSFGFGREVDRLFDHFWGGVPTGEGVEATWSPSVDVTDGEDSIVVTAELPGVKPEDVKVTVEDNVLTIEGEKKKEGESGDGRTHRVERSYGRFVRSFRLSAVDADSIAASYSEGILKVSLPKPETAKPKQISVSVN
jgi:HSP20 family protein